MKSGNQLHLTDEQISRAVIDETELTGDCRRHLSECLECRRQIERFREELSILGMFAGQAVPPMNGKVSLPREEPAAAAHGSSWLPSFAALVMAGLVLFVYFLGVETAPPRMTEMANLEEQSLEAGFEDEELMDEILEMVEYPLPDVMYEITGESGVDFDDFLQYVVPENQNDIQS